MLALAIILLWKKLALPTGGLVVPTGLKTAKVIPCSLGAALQRDFSAEGAAFRWADRADLAQRCRLHRLLGVVFQHERGEKYFLKIFTYDHNAVSAQQHGAFVTDDLQ